MGKMQEKGGKRKWEICKNREGRGNGKDAEIRGRGVGRDAG